jgi:hypothetical protein
MMAKKFSFTGLQELPTHDQIPTQVPKDFGRDSAKHPVYRSLTRNILWELIAEKPTSTQFNVIFREFFPAAKPHNLFLCSTLFFSPGLCWETGLKRSLRPIKAHN